MRLYLAGPMRGIPEFNFPAFFRAASWLRTMGHQVFSPAENDLRLHGDRIYKGNEKGDETIAREIGFDLRRALGDDLEWICKHAEGIALLPRWEGSKGACAEKAVADALNLEIVFVPHSIFL
jgi:hypothetical protein